MQPHNSRICNWYLSHTKMCLLQSVCEEEVMGTTKKRFLPLTALQSLFNCDYIGHLSLSTQQNIYNEYDLQNRFYSLNTQLLHVIVFGDSEDISTNKNFKLNSKF